MAIVFWCRCGTEIAVPDRDAGRGMPCPGCGVLLRVPMPERTGPVPSSSRPAFPGSEIFWLLVSASLVMAGGVLTYLRLSQ
jgi:hypothetical protein